MAGYQHGASNKYTPAQVERLRRIQVEAQKILADKEQAVAVEQANAERARQLEEIAGELLDVRLRKVQAQKRMEQRRLEETLKREQELTKGAEAAKELARIQEEHPQPEGIGAARMARLLREIEAAKRSGYRVHRPAGESYDIAA